MKKTRFSEERIVKFLHETDAAPVVEAAKRNRISDQTIYLWRKCFGKLEPVDVNRLRQWPAAEEADRGRRVHPGVLFDAVVQESNKCEDPDPRVPARL